jgi:hypothetical protein
VLLGSLPLVAHALLNEQSNQTAGPSLAQDDRQCEMKCLTS